MKPASGVGIEDGSLSGRTVAVGAGSEGAAAAGGADVDVGAGVEAGA